MTNKTISGAILAGVLLWSAAGAEGAENDQSAVGVNLDGISYHQDHWIFIDLFKQRMTGDWGLYSGGYLPPLDAKGWPTFLEAGKRVGGQIQNVRGQSPSHTYVLLYDGDGTVNVETSAKQVLSNQPGRIVFKLLNVPDIIYYSLTRTNPSNYVRNIRLVPIEFEATYQTEVFHPKFIEDLKKFKVIRFMDMLKTNSMDPISWATRAKVDDMGQGFGNGGGKGPAIEHMIDLCNRVNAHAWFNIRWNADDEYVRNFARLVRDRLNPGLKVYVEYANEVWNTGFKEHRAVGELGLAAGLGAPDYTMMKAALQYQGFRSRQVFEMFEQELGGRSRMVRVIAGQAGNVDRNRTILDFQHSDGTRTSQHADALATAPYFCHADEVPWGTIQSWTDDQVLDHCENVMLPRWGKIMVDNTKVAQDRGLLHIAYEGGQHMQGPHQAEPTARYTAINRHPRMKGIYEKYLGLWKQAGGQYFCHFNFVSSFSQFGYWGLKERQDQTRTEAPKYDGTLSFIESTPRWWTDVLPGSDTLKPGRPRNIRKLP